jgi:hypothetical protein
MIATVEMKLRNKMAEKTLGVTEHFRGVHCILKNILSTANNLFGTAGKKFANVDNTIFACGDSFAHLPNMYFHYNLESVRKF